MILFGETTPMPTPTMTVDPDSVTPGVGGFAFMVVIVIAVVLLIWDMNRRIRRVRYREEVREELDAEEAAQRESGTSPDVEKPNAAGVTDTDPDAAAGTTGQPDAPEK